MKLGDRIVVDHRLERETVFSKEPFVDPSRTWKIVPTSSKEVMVIGSRKLFNGTVYSEEGTRVFNPKESFDAFLVVNSLYRKPFLVDCRQGWHYMNQAIERTEK